MHDFCYILLHTALGKSGKYHHCAVIPVSWRNYLEHALGIQNTHLGHPVEWQVAEVMPGRPVSRITKSGNVVNAFCPHKSKQHVICLL